MSDHCYQSGFGNHFSTEALPGALPVGRNSPQRCPYGLYAEQLSATAFTAPRAENRRSWLYRIRPSVLHAPYAPLPGGRLNADYGETPPHPLRWDPLPLPTAPTDFVEGWVSLAGHGDPAVQAGAAVHLYTANRTMQRRVFSSADGELLIVPQLGRHRFVTEFGVLEAEPQEIVLIPRGVRFRVELPDGGPLRGYVCENYGAPFRLPDLGPIGANGPARGNDFLAPVAAYEDVEAPHQLVVKFLGRPWAAESDHSPLDVVAWHGNCAPCKYDLRRYNALGSISRDHPDPSIFLVLHSPSAVAGTSELDFVVFPPRVLAMQDTFRPPWFHRNVASELMGLIAGRYDAKATGFSPGAVSLHNCMSPHGPDAETWRRASSADLSQPDVIEGSMAFMFESRSVWRPTVQALAAPQLQSDYLQCWQGLPKPFDPHAP